ncbi:MAG: response regulator [Planctomycetota bacterium]
MTHYRILVVDDEPNVTAGLLKVLRKEPYEILSANSAAEALVTLSSQAVQVVISDERMPGMTGAEFLAEVRKRHPLIVRMMLTGHASTEAAIKAINEGEVYRFFTKPCNADELAATIRQALSQYELARRSWSLLREFRSQGKYIEQLEEEHPGISVVERDTSGAYVVDEQDCDVEDLLRQLEAEVGPGR